MKPLRERPWLGSAVIAALAVAASAVSIVNRFTYDDRYIIELNPLMRGLRTWWRVFAVSYWPKDWGGDGYRPFTLLAFKIEWAIGRGSPLVFHAANILLYAAVAVLVYHLGRRILPEWAAGVAAALFAVHPVHVEAVANVVGQSELIVAAAVLVALLLYLRDRALDGGRGALRPATIAAILALYAVACLTKEHGAVLPALLGVTELTLLVDPRPARERIRRLRPVYLALVAVAVVCVGARTLVITGNHDVGGFFPFMPFNTLHTSTRDRILTAIGVVPQWVRLLYWPARLSSEYGPPDIEIAQGSSISQLPGALLLTAILAFGVLLRRRQRVISFGIAFVCIALLPSSNFVVTAGIVLAERTLFLPSVGAMLIVGALAVVAAEQVTARERYVRGLTVAAAVACGLLIAAGIVRSTRRSRIWHDNGTLFHRAVIDSPLAYRAHYMLGAWDFEQKRKREGEAEYKKALALFPYDPFLAFNLAEQYRLTGLCEPAIPLYRFAHAMDPGFPMGHTQLSTCLLEAGHFDEAKAEALAAIQRGGQLRLLRRVIFLADSAKSADAGASGEKHSFTAMDGRPSKLPETMQKTAVSMGSRLAAERRN